MPESPRTSKAFEKSPVRPSEQPGEESTTTAQASSSTAAPPTPHSPGQPFPSQPPQGQPPFFVSPHSPPTMTSGANPAAQPATGFSAMAQEMFRPPPQMMAQHFQHHQQYQQPQPQPQFYQQPQIQQPGYWYYYNNGMAAPVPMTGGYATPYYMTAPPQAPGTYAVQPSYFSPYAYTFFPGYYYHPSFPWYPRT